ncbi:hypothetical protein Taro_014011, partial [Colocasia esculenta]|nr:hypothetical protein [Colocasia esculenta]
SPPGGCQLERTRILEYSLNRLPRMGVPGNGNNLSHGTSPQVPRTGRRTSTSRSDTNCNDPRTRPSAHAEDPIFAVAAHGSRDPEGL